MILRPDSCRSWLSLWPWPAIRRRGRNPSRRRSRARWRTSARRFRGCTASACEYAALMARRGSFQKQVVSETEIAPGAAIARLALDDNLEEFRGAGEIVRLQKREGFGLPERRRVRLARESGDQKHDQKDTHALLYVTQSGPRCQNRANYRKKSTACHASSRARWGPGRPSVRVAAWRAEESTFSCALSILELSPAI